MAEKGPEVFPCSDARAHTEDCREECPKCGSPYTMRGGNQHGHWKKCRMPTCQHRWNYTGASATAVGTNSKVKEAPKDKKESLHKSVVVTTTVTVNIS
jgi:hypothetical protein